MASNSRALDLAIPPTRVPRTLARPTCSDTPGAPLDVVESGPDRTCLV